MGKFNLNDLSSWPLWFKLLLAALLAAGTFYLASSYFVSDITDQISRAKTEISKEKQAVTKSYSDIANLENIRDETAKLGTTLTKALRFLPNEVSMPALIDSVYQKASDNGIVFQSFTPGKDIDNKYYITKPIKLETEVGFLSMANFIESVTALNRIMNVESVSFAATDRRAKRGEPVSYDTENRPLKMTAELRTYIFKDNDGKAKSGRKK